MLRLFLSAAAIIAFSLAGRCFAGRLTRRRRSLSVLIESMKHMNSLISFGGYDIRRVIRMSFIRDNQFGFFDCFSDDSIPFDTQWSDAIGSLDRSLALNDGDKELLLAFGNTLGVTDTEGQLGNLSLYIELFCERLEQAKAEESKKSKLYTLLGFSAGCAAALML